MTKDYERAARARERSAGKVVPADGLTMVLKGRARDRRSQQQGLMLAGRGEGARDRNDIVPELRIEYRRHDALRPANRKIRKADQIQGARLERSLRRFGICVPILIDEQGQIVHGHGVWEAAGRLHVETVPAIVISHLTLDERRLLAIALNRLGETGTWDEASLAYEFGELIDLDIDVSDTGFELAEIDALLIEEEPTPEVNEEPLSLPAEARSRPGDLWRLGSHRLLQGDARDPAVYRRLCGDGELARLVFTDVPYNVPNKGHVTGKDHAEFAMAHGEMGREEFSAFNSAWMSSALAVLADGGMLATFIDWRSVEIVLAAGRELGLSLLNIVVWQKTNGGQGSLWRSQHELLPVFKKGNDPHVNNVQLGRHGRWRSNVWMYPGGSSMGSEARSQSDAHPTVKPRAMLEDALLDVTQRGDVVLDPFLGSGSTLLAASTTGRICRGVEIDARYCDLAIKRWQTLTGEQAVLDETGETFAQVCMRRRAALRSEEGNNG